MSMTGSDELHLLRALLRASDYGVLLSGADRRDLLCNRQFCDLFGLDAALTVQSSPQDVRSQVLPRLKFPDEFLRVLDAVYSDPYLTQEDEVELVAPRPCLLRRYTAPVIDADGALVGRLWTFLDITQTRGLEKKVQAQAAQLRVQARQLATALKTVSGRLHKAETTLSLAQQQLFESEKLSAVGLLAASVAHDIRNVLTPLTIELQLADQNDPVLRAESLTAMRTQVDRLALMTHRLLSLARPQRSERALVDLVAMARHIIGLLKPQAKMEGVGIVLRISRALPCILGDGVQIEQVLINLILNGTQAMQATGGTLKIALTEQKKGDRPGICIRIQDTGREFLRRRDGACSTRFLPLGRTAPVWGYFPVGASWRRMAATSVSAAAGRGLRLLSGCPAMALPPRRKGNLMAGRILIVEDDRAIAQSLTRLLSLEGYYVAHERTAEEAAAHLRSDPSYDLALLDVMLPGADGFACCRQLRAQGWQSPVIMLTGRSAAAYRVAGLDAGADDYVSKPFDPAELLARIRAHLRRSREYGVSEQATEGIPIGIDLVLDTVSRQVFRQKQPIHVTEREYELLVLFARQPGVALDKTWLFQQVWGGASELGMKVLAVYMRRLRRKIEIDMDAPKILLTVRGYGYKLAALE